jgi:MFS transporter, UMF1 family
MVTTVEASAQPGSTRAERVAWYSYDWAISGFRATVVTVFLGPYLGSIASDAADSRGLVHPFGIPVAAGSLFAYTVSVSVLLTVLVLPLVGAIADRTYHKKQLLGLFAYLGAGATVGLVFLTGTRYLLGALLFLVANICYGAAHVVFNSFLPQLAGPDDRDRVSSFGWAVGYIGGGLLLMANLVALQVLGDAHKAEVARWSIVSAGVWWAAFTALPMVRLRNRPPLEGGHRGPVLTDGFRQLGRTLAGLRAYPLTLFFLAAYLCYNDGIQTVITLASVYADKELHLVQAVQVETILLVQFVAFAGAWGLGRIARRTGAKRAVLGSLAVCRSLFSQLIPAGKEAEYFGLYEISSDGTSWLGPLLFGVIYQVTHTYRASIISMLVFFVVGFVLLLAVPVRRAIVAAGNTPPRVV